MAVIRVAHKILTKSIMLMELEIEEKKVIRKADIRIIPMLFSLHLMNYLNSINICFANLFIKNFRRKRADVVLE